MLAAGKPAQEEQRALVEIEDALAAAALSRLDGGKKADARKALETIGARLGL